MSSTLAVWLSCTPVYIQAHSYFSTSFQKSVVCCLSFYVLEVLIDSKWGDPESDSKNIQAKRYILITNTKPSCICHKKFIEKSLGIGEAGRNYWLWKWLTATLAELSQMLCWDDLFYQICMTSYPILTLGCHDFLFKGLTSHLILL